MWSSPAISNKIFCVDEKVLLSGLSSVVSSCVAIEHYVNVTSATEKWKVSFHFILINVNVNLSQTSHMGLVAILLDSAALASVWSPFQPHTRFHFPKSRCITVFQCLITSS